MNIHIDDKATPIIVLPSIAPQKKPIDIIVNEETGKKIINISHEEKTTIFWECMAMLKWKNKSDGVFNIRVVTEMLHACSRNYQNGPQIIKEMYDYYYDLLYTVASNFGLFSNDDDIPLYERPKIISHVIALGNKQYKTVLEDVTLLKYFMESDEYQSLHEILDEKLKK